MYVCGLQLLIWQDAACITYLKTGMHVNSL